MSNAQNQLVLSKPGELMKYLERSRSAIEMCLPNHLKPDRMLRLAVTCFSTTPQLRECTAQSILSSIIVASQLGLEPGIAGQAYLVPYGQTCTLVPGWQGLVGLLNNSGRATAWTGAVFEGDTWEFELGSKPRCRHLPGPHFGDVEKMIWVYACGKVNGSEQPVIEAWPMERVWRHRDRYNKVGKKHYSYNQPEMYARKVVLLQVLKYMPRSVELNNAIAASHAAEMGHQAEVRDGVIIDMEQADEPKDAETESRLLRNPAPPQEKPPTDKTEASGVATDVPPAAELPAQVRALMQKDGVQWRSVVDKLVGNGMAEEGAYPAVEDAPDGVLQAVVNAWPKLLKSIQPGA